MVIVVEETSSMNPRGEPFIENPLFNDTLQRRSETALIN